MALLLAAAVALPSSSLAHEIPADVTVQAFVRPQADRLLLLVRAPLEAMRDYEFPRRGEYLDIEAAEDMLPDAAMQWIGGAVTLYEEGDRLPDLSLLRARISQPGDGSFGSFDQAMAHLVSPRLQADIGLVAGQALLDVLFEAPIVDPQAAFSVRSELSRLGLRTTTVIRFQPLDGNERAFQFTGDPGLVRLDPRWHQAAWRFVRLGFGHILDGIDHLLFLLVLVVPCRRWRPLVAIVTSFTVAHSLTLIASAFGLAPGALWFPPLIEMLIALSIVYMALENIVGPRMQHRWAISFVFGLVHGFGFSFALRETLQFAGSHLLTSLLAFNVGVELGQLVVLAVAVPALNMAFRRVVAERVGTIVLSALLAHSAWHWMSERFADLRQYEIGLPAVDLMLLVGIMRAAMLGLALALIVWSLSGLYRRLGLAGPPADSSASAD